MASRAKEVIVSSKLTPGTRILLSREDGNIENLKARVAAALRLPAVTEVRDKLPTLPSSHC